MLHLREFETFSVELVSSASYDNQIKKLNKIQYIGHRFSHCIDFCSIAIATLHD